MDAANEKSNLQNGLKNQVPCLQNPRKRLSEEQFYDKNSPDEDLKQLVDFISGIADVAIHAELDWARASYDLQDGSITEFMEEALKYENPVMIIFDYIEPIYKYSVHNQLRKDTIRWNFMKQCADGKWIYHEEIRRRR